jgi:hypothetical protein
MKMVIIKPSRKTGLLALATALALLVSVPAASAAPAASQKATPKCWLQVVNDWLAHGTVTQYYAIPCYTQAIQHLSEYPDIKQYSTAIDDIHRALLVAIHEEHGGPGSGSGGGPGSSGGGGAIGGSGGSGSGGSGTGGHRGLISRIAHDIGPGNAQSIPLPLLVLGGLAALLLLTAAATWVMRRMQARRVTPAPAHAHASSSVRRDT